MSTKREDATEGWTRQIEETYGALVIELRHTQANGFFPRVDAWRASGMG